MSEPLSDYERDRVERIRRNNAYLLSLGLLQDIEAAKPKPKLKSPPKPKLTPVDRPARRSSRLEGLPVEELELDVIAELAGAPPSAPEKAPRDPMRCWWTATSENPLGDVRPPLTVEQRRALEEPLSAEDRSSLNLGKDDDWVTDMLRFSRAYGGKHPIDYCVPSRENFSKVLQTVSVLAGGEGVTCNYRSGTFDAGVRYTPKDDLDEALGRAIKWLPSAKDKSNGWTFTHPFTKMKQYQRALFWRHLFPFVWPGAQPSDQAQETAISKAEECTGAEASAWLRMAEAAELCESGNIDGKNDDEDAPLLKRRKRA